MPIDTGLINVNVSCGTASASEDGNGNPTASGTGSLANLSISLSLTDVLQSLLGGSLPSASPVRQRPRRLGHRRIQLEPAAAVGPVAPDIVNGILPANLALNPTSVAGGSQLSGECSVLSGLLSELNAANSTSPVTGLITGILNQVSVSPVAMPPRGAAVIQLGGSKSAVSTSGNVVTDSVTQQALDVNLFGLADLQVAPDDGVRRARPQQRHRHAELQRGPRLVLDQRLAAVLREHHAADGLVNQILAEPGAAAAHRARRSAPATGIIELLPGREPPDL